MLNNYFNFKKGCELLKESNKILINKCTLESLELASSILKEYPDRKITILDNNNSHLKKELKSEMFDKLIT